MCSRCWTTSSQVGLQTGACMRIILFAGGRDMLRCTVAHALPPAVCREASRSAAQTTQRSAKHGQLTDVPLACAQETHRGRSCFTNARA